jgi:hypothetical protein
MVVVLSIDLGVGARSLNVTGLLAAVAHTLAGSLRWAVTGEMADLATYEDCQYGR